MDDLRTLAEEFELEIVTDDASFWWEARYEDLGPGTLSDVEVLVQVRREVDSAGTLWIEVYSGGLLETSANLPVSSLVDDDNMSIPPTQIVVPVPSVNGQSESAVNDMTVRMYVQSGNGKKLFWSYTDLTGTN